MQNIVGQWLTSLRHYASLCLLLSSPERLAFNPYSLSLTIAAYFAIGLLLVDERNSYIAICARILLELAMLAAITHLGLKLKQLPNRFPQAFSALVGINLIVTAVSIPLQRSFGVEGEQAATGALYAFIAILVWNLAAISLVFKRAFEISTRLSAMLSFSYFIVYYVLVATIL